MSDQQAQEDDDEAPADAESEAEAADAADQARADRAHADGEFARRLLALLPELCGLDVGSPRVHFARDMALIAAFERVARYAQRDIEA
jgi:hypothetical protein